VSGKSGAKNPSPRTENSLRGIAGVFEATVLEANEAGALLTRRVL